MMIPMKTTTNPFQLLVRRHHQQAMLKTLYYAILAGMFLGAVLAIYIEEL